MTSIGSKEAFDRLMEGIDTSLRDRAVPIPARELQAFRQVALLTQQELPMTGPFDFTPVPGQYTGSSLAGHIVRWMRDRYGDRLKIDMSHGYTAVLIRGDAWLLRIPEIFGTAEIVCERDLDKTFPNLVVKKPGHENDKLQINLLGLIEQLPQGLASSLTDHEHVDLLRWFVSSYSCYRVMAAGFINNDLTTAALNDLTASARHATARKEEYGLSRWSSLQAAEKFLKLFLHQRRISIPHTHNLAKLFGLAEVGGLKAPPPGFVDVVQCDAGVRYDQRIHVLSDVVAAHRAATSIGCVVAKTLLPGL